MTKVLVATAKTQGARDNDYNWCIEGELVWFPPMCRRGIEDPDGRCGCGRGFGGLNSHRATTTAMVRTLAGLSRDDYVKAIGSSMAAQGYDSARAPVVADAMLDLVADLPDGAVTEHRQDQLRVRAPVS
ncbi:MAG: hypothetical protein GEV04_02495 [Actinophytocola sp.]|nr:hypothetical protein [Actinophytocola sp.]